jgi:signal transduction histidine kinase
MVTNLVDNALRYNVPGGRIHVTTGMRGERAVLSVANTGATIPATAVGRLFQPFQRLGAERTSYREGLGLGMSIVAAIADAHDAEIAACPQPGGGLQVDVTFPKALSSGCAGGRIAYASQQSGLPVSRLSPL